MTTIVATKYMNPAFVVLTFVDGRLLWPELVTRHDDGIVEFRGEVIHV